MVNRKQALQQLLEEKPADSFIRFALSIEYIKEGDDRNAVMLLKQLSQDDPEYLALYYHLGKAYERLNSAEDAIATYRMGMHVAKKQNDLKTFSELNVAIMLLDDE